MNSARRAGADATLFVAAFVVGLPALLYPLGRDQGLYFYIGREWLERGRIPYLDSFDIKTPGIYAVHALAIALFGEELWGARLLELIAVVALGAIVAPLAAPRGTRVRPGARGATSLAVSVVYYEAFDFWNSGQCEIWCVVFLMASIALAARTRSAAWGAFGSGAAFATALAFKTPIAIFAPLVLAYLGARAWGPSYRRGRRLVAATLRFGAGAAVVLGAVLGYFAAHHALYSMYELVVVNMRYYVLHGAWVGSVEDVLDKYRIAIEYLWPCAALGAVVLAVQVARALRAGETRAALRHLGPVALFVVAIAAVTMQLKFCWYHWGLLMAATALTAALAVEAVAAYARSRPRAVAPAVVVALAFCAGTLFARDAGVTPESGHRGAVRGALLLARGEITRAQMVSRFDSSVGLLFSAGFSQEIGEWLRANTNPEDTIAIRSMEPQIYAIARRHHTGRFFWTTFLTYEQWAYRMMDWREEDRRVFVDTPPTYVVAGAFVHEGPDSIEYFEPLGYSVVKSFGGWAVLAHRETHASARAPATAPPRVVHEARAARAARN